MSNNQSLTALKVFTGLYLLLGGVFFVQNLNFEFIAYVAVLLAIFGGVLWIQKSAGFPSWLLWLLSLWGLMHILGGSVPTQDGVLFAYRIYPLLDLGGEFYILKYDQVVHAYLYGVVAVMAYHLIRIKLLPRGQNTFVFLLAVMAALGVSGLNEIMEFFISLTVQNGVGGYHNTMLDMCFNLAGALVATWSYVRMKRE
ncbi:hypothetical protein A2837_00070 [Candidatus Kaiserbacteria bacterium RIFCSPHIGHO2_01_FULL_46_22]|uniref:DUF2238 domain-containing protein n=1 Tax=Candidatus Kaiserbacteria bacterium RIFCSPHIGHO2_01_FULL_46_22 TaxID=1798475 RepID=A0A1F6BZ46_9BACT|nr:MAG: hypothetical protein A2837_00070 [Candidatus Kaiserbacteria bacterium RIFCSPHIGHO2_01_FULL_46_22]